QEAHELVPDKNRLGSFTCVEAQVCTDGSNFAHQDAGANGYSIVYEGKGSIAQPDYTAACLNMKSANVQVLVTVFDQASSRRTARDCARQGVKPVYVFSSFEQTDQQVADFGTAIVSSQVFPFAGVDSPG